MEDLNKEKQGFDFKEFIDDSKAVLLNPKDYFGRMPVSGGFGEPIIKVLIYGAVIGIINYIWFLTGLGIASGSSWLGSGIGIAALFSTIIFTVVGLFIGGAIMLVISAILKGNTDYEANVRVVAALMVISIVRSVFGFVGSINLYLSAIVSIIISLWGLYIAYYALTLTLKAGEKGSKILLLVFAVLVVITSFTGIAARKAMQKFKDNYNIEEMSDAEQQEATMKMVEKMTGGEVKAEDMQKMIDESKKAAEEEKDASSKSKFVKPAGFPEETFAELTEVLSDKSYLNDAKMDNAVKMFVEVKQLTGLDSLSKDESTAKLDSMAKLYEFADFDEVITGTISPAMLSATILSLAAKSEGQTGSQTMLKAFLSQNPLSLDDLKYTYDNWDKVMSLQDEAIK